MDKDKSLRPPFLGSVFACAAINFPPDVVAIPHRDHLNLGYGWCSITPLGHFDHKVGAHLVLPELELAIQFPVGSTIFIPSAAFTHYNTTIQEGETRSSITQFSAGGIFRWTAYGHQLKREAEAACVQGKKWWEKGKGLYEVWPRGETDAKKQPGMSLYPALTPNSTATGPTTSSSLGSPGSHLDDKSLAPVELNPWIPTKASQDHSLKRTRKDSWVGEDPSNSWRENFKTVQRKRSRNCMYVCFP
jgi:hypothetical protein